MAYNNLTGIRGHLGSLLFWFMLHHNPIPNFLLLEAVVGLHFIQILRERVLQSQMTLALTLLFLLGICITIIGFLYVLIPWSFPATPFHRPPLLIWIRWVTMHWSTICHILLPMRSSTWSPNPTISSFFMRERLSMLVVLFERISLSTRSLSLYRMLAVSIRSTFFLSPEKATDEEVRSAPEVKVDSLIQNY